MTWDYWIDFPIWKETNKIVRKIKGTTARKSYLFWKLYPLVLIAVISFFYPLLKGEFDLVASLAGMAVGYLASLFFVPFILSGRKAALKKKLPAHYRITLQNGMLREELTERDGTITRREGSLRELLEIKPIQGGLFLRFSNSVVVFLPRFAFTRVTWQESAAYIQEAAAAAKDTIAEPEASFLETEEDNPMYGTLYFSIPASHMYTLYRSCNLDICKNWVLVFQRSFQNVKAALIFFGFAALIAVLCKPEITFYILLGILLFFAVMYFIIVLSTLILCKKVEKKEKLAPLYGMQQIELYEDRLCVKWKQNSQEIYYGGFNNLYEIKEAYYLLQKKASGLIMIPKWAFTTPEEETMFVTTIRKNILDANKKKNR